MHTKISLRAHCKISLLSPVSLQTSEWIPAYHLEMEGLLESLFQTAYETHSKFLQYLEKTKTSTTLDYLHDVSIDNYMI